LLRIEQNLTQKKYGAVSNQIKKFKQLFPDSVLNERIIYLPVQIKFYTQPGSSFLSNRFTADQWLYIFNYLQNQEAEYQSNFLIKLAHTAVRQYRTRKFDAMLLFLEKYYDNKSNKAPCSRPGAYKADFLYNYAWLLYKNGFYKKSLQLFSYVKQIKPGLPCDYYIGAVYYYTAKYKKSIRVLNAFKDKPSSAKDKNRLYWTDYFLIKNYKRLHKYKTSYKICRRFCSVYDDERSWRLLLSVASAVSEKRYDLVKKKYLAKFPHSYQSYVIRKQKALELLMQSNINSGLKQLKTAYRSRQQDYNFISMLYQAEETETIIRKNRDFFYDYFLNRNYSNIFPGVTLLQAKIKEHNSNCLLLVSNTGSINHITNLIRPFFTANDYYKKKLLIQKSSFFSNYYNNSNLCKQSSYWQRLKGFLALGYDKLAETEIKQRFKDKKFLQFCYLNYLYRYRNDKTGLLRQYYYIYKRCRYKAFLPYSFYKRIYPRFRKNEVEYISSLYKVKPAVVYSIIRAESYFKEKAVSAAGASGLMQLMYSTGNWIYKKRKFNDFFTFDLFDPELNLQLGISYFADLLKQFNHTIYALAAYNAGSGNIARWQRQKYRSLLHFAIHIPFDETERYVQKVIRNYIIYSQIY